MELILKATAICLLGGLLALLLKKSNPELSLLLTVGACVLILASVAKELESVSDFINEIITRSGLSAEFFSPLWKTIGIAWMAKTGTELCKDAEEHTMAALVETTGAIGAIIVAIPLFQAVWEMLQSLI